MIKSGRYLFVVVFAGISLFFVGVVSAAFDAYLEKSGTPMNTQSTEIGQKGEEVEFSWGSAGEGTPDRSKQPGTRLEPGDNFQPRQPGVTLEPGDNFQPRQPGTRLEPGDNFRPGAADTPQQRNLPRGQRGIGGVIPPDFDDDATHR